MNEQQENPFAEYGNQGSIQQAIEDLAVQCMMVGIAPPKLIVFPKGELAKVNNQFAKSVVVNGKSTDANVIDKATAAGVIKLVEEA